MGAMTNEEILRRLDAELAEEILDLSDEEIDVAIKADGNNPLAVAELARWHIRQAIDQYEVLKRLKSKEPVSFKG